MSQKTNTPESFWAKVAKAGPDDCWPWTAGCRKDGYGRFMMCAVAYRTHRLAWQLTYGLIPDGLHVLHKCDNPPCCNPAHLFLGDPLTNSIDRESKGRGNQANGVASGSAKLTESQVLEIRAAGPSVSNVRLAELFKVSENSIRKIIHHRTWKHI